MLSILAVAIILSSLYIPSSSSAQFPNSGSSQTLKMPTLAPKDFHAIQSPSIQILSPNLNTTTEADNITQCDSTAPEGMERSIKPEDDNATISPNFKAFESLDLGIRFNYPSSWNKSQEDESYVSFISTVQGNVDSFLTISKLDGAVAPLERIYEVFYDYNRSGYNTTQPAAGEPPNSIESTLYYFSYSYINNNTDSKIYGKVVVITQNNVTYEIEYKFKPTDYGDFSLDVDEFNKVLDSIQIFDVKRYEKGFYNNSTGVILRYPSLLPDSLGDLRLDDVSNNKVNFTNSYPSYSNAVFDLKLSVFPYESLKELDNELKENLTNYEIDYGNICETEIADNFGINTTTAHKLDFNYTSKDSHIRKGLLFYTIYNDTYAHLFNFTADVNYYDLLLPTVEEMYNSLKIVVPPTKYAKEDLKASQQGLFLNIEYPKNWNFTPGPIGFEIYSPIENNSTDKSLEGLSMQVGPAGLDTLEDVVNRYVITVKNYTNFQIVYSNESALSNNTAHKIVYTYKDDIDKDILPCYCDIKRTAIFTIIDKKIYTLEHWTELDKFSSYMPTIENIVDSIKFDKNLPNVTTKSGIQLNGGPVDLAINPFTNRLYVAIPEARQIQVIDGATDQVIQNITIGAYPNAVALNPYTNKIYVASPETDMIYVIDGVTNNITAKIQAGPLLGDIAVDTNEFGTFSTLVFVANNGNASISIIDDAKGRVVKNIKTSEGPYSIGIDSMNNRAYITTNVGLDIIDYTTNGERKVFATLNPDNITLDYYPLFIVVDSSTSKAYTTNSASNTVSVIDTVLNENISQINVGLFPNSLAFNPTDKKLYVSNTGNNTVSVVDTTIGKNVGTITTDSIPYDIAINPNTNIIYLAGFESKSLSTVNSSSGITTVALTFHINPPNAGHIECAGKKIPENSYQRLAVNTECEPIASDGFSFTSWSPVGTSNNSKGTLNISQYATYTASFTSLPQSIQTASPAISITGLFAVILLAAIMPTFKSRKKIQEEEEKIEKGEKNVQTSGILPGAHVGDSIRKVEKEKEKEKNEKDEVKGEEDSNLISKAEIITIDATVIIGVLIFLSLTEGFEISEQYQINIITASIVFPFAISAIIAVTAREKFATRLMIAGFINLMISVILIAIMKL